MIISENKAYRCTSLPNALARETLEEAQHDERIGVELIDYRNAIVPIAAVERRRGEQFEWRRDPDGTPVYTQIYEGAPWSEQWEDVSAIVRVAAENEIGRSAAWKVWEEIGDVVEGVQTDIVGDAPWAAYAIIARRLITDEQYDIMIAPMRKLGVDFFRIQIDAAMLYLAVDERTSVPSTEEPAAEPKRRWWQHKA